MTKNTSFSLFPNQYFIDLCLYQYGYEQCKPLASFGPYVRNHYLFHYVISGSGTLVATDSQGIDRTYRIRSGQGFMIFPNQNTSYYADSEHPWEYTWIEFDGARVEEILMNCNITIKNPIYYPTDKILANKLKESLLSLNDESERSHFGLIGELYTCMDYLLRSSKNRRTILGERVTDTYIKEAINFIINNFHNDITVQDIADFCNVSRGYLSKILKKHTGQSPQQLLMDYRMSKAAQLLQLTDLSVGDIGKAVGYENQLHFSRAFKTIYKISPLQWRKNIKK
ncbi:MAG: AraC family transcriptional regulator [Firmicutes bacterium]|uniref:AraC family transcriptional regulator n=1 Tax=Candidatus Scybalomonas excrementavium TaxID=2840943 RepID=A0A9D9N7Z9_9FIRM|nr:AraC family transcriptional regulator [Candidatus Scybalomonas excrementavium]